MTPRLKEEVESRVATQLESRDCWEEGETRTQEQMEAIALEDIVAMTRDCGGLFKRGLTPDFEGSPEWVAEMRAKQAASLAEMDRQHGEWIKLWREAKRELRGRYG